MGNRLQKKEYLGTKLPSFLMDLIAAGGAIPALKKRMVLVNEVQFIVLFVFFNLFMR